VEDLRSLLDEQPDEPEEWDSSGVPELGRTNQAYMFGFGSATNDILRLHPTPDKIPLYWYLFKENCDLLVKVLHVPTMEPLILQAAAQLDRISKGFEALMFAIYFSVVVSLSEGECLQILGGRKDSLLHIYKFSMEQALARAGFLETEEMIVLQAYVIFLFGLRNHCRIRLMWTLTALLVRLAQNTGIHRDGTHFNLSPFAVEMRRRLWWNICVLDSRASEDSGYDAAIPHEGVDTRMPLNINDFDLVPNMTEFPEPRIGYTDMTFSLVRFEAFKIFRRLQYVSAGTIGRCGKFHAEKSLAEKKEWISNFQARLEELCLKHINLSDPFSWFIATISRIISNKMRLVAHHPYLRRGSCAGLSEETRDALFIASIEQVEDWLLLNMEWRTSKWRWLCETYVQWYALAFLLSELCTRTQGEVVERAWNAIDAALQLGSRFSSASGQTKNADSGQHSNLDEVHSDAYKPLGRLWKKAHSARVRALLSEGTGAGNQINEEMRSAANDPPVWLTFEADGVDLPCAEFDSFAHANQISLSDCVPSLH
jgi:hypothetical protein